MSILPTGLSRVSNLLKSSVAISSINSTQSQLLTLENELSTGKQVNSPSDNPASAAIIQQLNQTLADRQSFSTNLNSASSQLGEVDNSLSSLNDLLQQAQTIASQNVGSTATASQRQSAAAVVQTLISQSLSVGNTQFNGVYIFGGDKSNQAPFSSDSNGAITFAGTSDVLQNDVDTNTLAPFTADGAEIFGALSNQQTGATNLDPAATANTRLIDMNGANGNGIHLGSISIGNGTTSAIVDLSHADTLGDVVNSINAAGVAGVTASIGANGLVLSGGGNISVNEVGGGTTASDLGVLTPTGAGAGVPVNGQNLQTKVTPLTMLSSLRGGAGLDLSGLTIANGSTTTHISFTGLSTVQDVINAINSSTAGVKAQINSTGTGIDIVNPIQGNTMSISENGGTTASELGLQTMSPGTLLSSLNGGKGVNLVSGADLQITRRDGSTFQVDLNGATTIQDVINDINTADAGGGVTASFDNNTNGIVLTDSTGGGGTLAVSSINASTAATDLGLSAPAVGNTISGTDVNPVQPSGIFADLQQLQTALNNNDPAGITAAAQSLQNDYNRVSVARGVNGAQMQEVQNRQSQISTENTATQSFLSNLQDTDYTTAVTQFQSLQTALQASYEVTADMGQMSLVQFLSAP
jgi:flagellar hook-associated protein 3 FlgL